MTAPTVPGGSAVPLRITESCTGIAGVGRCSRTEPETCQLRCAWTNPFSEAATSAALVPLTIAFVWLLLSLLSKDYNGVRSELGHPFPAILTMLYVLVGLYHMELGMRSIIADYVHGRAREWALMANLFFVGALALACVYAVLRIGFV